MRLLLLLGTVLLLLCPEAAHGEENVLPHAKDLRERVTIYRDDFGLAHVIGEDDESGVCVSRGPDCGRRFVKPAIDAMIVMLLAVGIEVSMWSAALGRAGRRSEVAADSMGAITSAELEAFGRQLGDESDLLRHFEAS